MARSVKKDMRQLVARFKKQGGSARLTAGQHYALTHPRSPGVTVTAPSTPSCYRALQNAKATIKRELGIEL